MRFFEWKVRHINRGWWPIIGPGFNRKPSHTCVNRHELHNPGEEVGSGLGIARNRVGFESAL